MFGEKLVPKADAVATYRRLHSERKKALKDRFSKSLDLPELSYKGETHQHGTNCEHSIREYYVHLLSVHADLAGDARGNRHKHAEFEESDWEVVRAEPRPIVPSPPRPGIAAGPPAAAIQAIEMRTLAIPLLSDLKENYLFGNGFAEGKPKPAAKVTEP
jgi:hypothetical protein